jgi:hypothetical protein
MNGDRSSVMSKIACLLGLTWTLACSGSNSIVCKPDPITGSQFCQGAGGEVAGPAVTTAVAAGVYAVTGCTVNGCVFPDRCNETTKRCEPITCSENRECPAGYSCDLSSHHCR